MDHYLSIVRQCLEIGVKPRCHLEDITRSDIYGFVIPFCQGLKELGDELGIPVKIRMRYYGLWCELCRCCHPKIYSRIIYGLRKHAGITPDMIEFHGHNDFIRLSLTPQRHGYLALQASTAPFLELGKGSATRP